VVQKSVAPVRQRSFAAPTIPATQTGRDIQASLNYFGFNAGSVDGRIGRNTRAAIAEYQAYMGYPATGTLNGFEQELLLRSYTRAQIGGEDTFRRLAASPDGTRGLLRQYRADFASGAIQPQAGSTGFQGYAATN
jgi:peptidoglycan hydrolase-like protein with peptidoglycan-binding domain